MRFNTKVAIYKQEKVEDGLGGYEYNNSLVVEAYAHKSYLNSTYFNEVFGYASTTAISLIFRNTIEIDNKEKYKVKIGTTYYNILDIKVFKNRTRFFLEVMDNA